ncbi:MAG TPA: 2-dehydro-3-deoxyglucarate aldolase [Microbacterium sp.]|nr:2-dehydro-3-deoxyglucarate aldolase [Microbacterium sp.]
MSFRLEPAPSFRDRLAAASPSSGEGRALVGAWICSGSSIAAEIVAGSGLDWTLIDGEHSPIGLESTLALLQAVAPYPITPVLRVPSNDAVLIKQFLDLGAQNLLVPMVNTEADAAAAVAATRYPPLGIRGVGSALSRAAQFNRIENYLQRAHEITSLYVQIETDAAVHNAHAIAAVDGVDGVFIGPSDLAASMGLLGQQQHPDVIAAVERTIAAVRDVGKPVGVNAFDPDTARRYLAAGASFVLVAADVSILARATEKLAAEWIPAADDTQRASY